MEEDIQELREIPFKKPQNPEVEYLINFLKEKMDLNVLDGTIAENRKYCWLCLKKFKKEGVEIIIKTASQDEFWFNKITSFKSLYYKGVQIASSLKNHKKENIAII